MAEKHAWGRWILEALDSRSISEDWSSLRVLDFVSTWIPGRRKLIYIELFEHLSTMSVDFIVGNTGIQPLNNIVSSRAIRIKEDFESKHRYNFKWTVQGIPPNTKAQTKLYAFICLFYVNLRYQKALKHTSQGAFTTVVMKFFLKIGRS